MRRPKIHKSCSCHGTHQGAKLHPPTSPPLPLIFSGTISRTEKQSLHWQIDSGSARLEVTGSVYDSRDTRKRAGMQMQRRKTEWADVSNSSKTAPQRLHGQVERSLWDVTTVKQTHTLLFTVYVCQVTVKSATTSILIYIKHIARTFLWKTKWISTKTHKRVKTTQSPQKDPAALLSCRNFFVTFRYDPLASAH